VAKIGVSREEAWALLTEWVESESLRRHCLAVEAAMRAYAAEAGADAELWGVTGLLHDADYERFPDLATGHPRMIMAELERRGAPAEMVRAIAAHAESLGVEPETPIERTLVAVDELCGFLVACAVVRPTGIHGLAPKSVRKKLRQPSFAAAVNRDDVRRGAEELGLEFDEHVARVIAALEPHAAALGVEGAR
jgi:putative nucleotidyltransferase with HDIG domain